jgi:purine catabolism regulator
VRDVLGLDLVAAWDPEVVAGAGSLDRPVRWLHVAEAGDVAVMLSGGEMVLTTGVLLAGDERAQAEYVEAMHRADVAAVVLGLGRAFDAAPAAMRRSADLRGLPLIALHRPAPFALLTEAVQTRLVHDRFAVLDLSERVRASLGGLNLAGASLQQLLDETAVYAGCPALVVNLAYRVLASAGEGSAVGGLLVDWERVSRQMASLTVRGTGSGVVSGPGGSVVAPLATRGRHWGWLVLFGFRRGEDVGRVLADRAAEALALHQLLLGDHGRASEGEAAESLLSDLVSGTERPERLATRARAAGLPVNRRVFVPLVVRFFGEAGGQARAGETRGTPVVAAGAGRLDPGPPGPAGGELTEAVLRVLAESGLEGLAARVSRIAAEGTAVLLSIPRDRQSGSRAGVGSGARADVDATVDRFGTRLRDHLAARGRAAVVGAGSPCTDLDELRHSFAEAGHVMDAALADPPASPVARLRDVRLRGLVRLLRDEPALQSFIEREVGPLFEHPHLFDVLRTYLRTGRNKSLAAQAHHISRPALYRRLRGIELLLGVDLDDWDQLTTLYVAILAYEAQHAPASGPGPGPGPESGPEVCSRRGAR